MKRNHAISDRCAAIGRLSLHDLRDQRWRSDAQTQHALHWFKAQGVTAWSLMGHDTSTLQVADITDAQFRQMLGLSLHVGTAGMMMAALLASLGHAP